MSQLSFFSADMDPPGVGDLSGLLAAHGQLVSSGAGTRVSVVVDEPWRTRAIAELVAAAGLEPELGLSEERRPLVRTAPSAALGELGRQWRRGAVKTVPVGWTPGGRALRAWVLAAGQADDAGFLLGLDPHAPETHLPLAAALSRAGVAPTLLGARGRAPGLRISGRRRLLRLAETVGPEPDGAGARGWPRPSPTGPRRAAEPSVGRDALGE